MRFSTALVALASTVVVSAANISVLVGDGGLLAFTPPSITAASGDTINFEFRAKNHSVTQSTFANPCQLQTTPKTGIDSGFQAVPANATNFPSWSITVDDPTTPLWFFCAQTVPANHCNTGMVFAVNAPPDKSFDAYQANAKASTPGSSGSGTATAPSSGATSGTSAGTPAGTSIAPTGSGFSTVIGGSSAAGPTNTSSGTAPTGTAGAGNGAFRMGGSTTTLLAVVGLIAGLVL